MSASRSRLPCRERRDVGGQVGRAADGGTGTGGMRITHIRSAVSPRFHFSGDTSSNSANTNFFLGCNSVPGLFVPWTIRTITGQFVPWCKTHKNNVSYQNVQCVSNALNFLTFPPNGWDFLVQILLSDYTFLSTLDYKFLFNYLQLSHSCAILSATTIICSKCPPSAETHAGWWHLIWYKFVKVGDNRIKICKPP